MSEEEKKKERWAAHEATAKELSKIEIQLKTLNDTLKKILEIINYGVHKI